MKTRPNVIRIGEGLYRLDLRGKAFRSVLGTVSGGKQTLEFGKRVDAEKKATEIETLLTEYGSKKLETLEAVMRIDPMDLQAKLAPFGKTVQDAVDFYYGHLVEQKRITESQTFGKLMDDWLAEKKRRVDLKTLRHDTYDDAYWRANGEDGYKTQWGTRPVASITKTEILAWVENRMVKKGIGVTTASQITKKHYLSVLSQFFVWCRKNEYAKENPCEFLSVEINEDSGVVEYFTPEEATLIMTLSQEKKHLSLLPYHAICMFSGVRTAECERLTWENIDFDNKSIVLYSTNAKTFARRVEMQPNLVAWLTWFHSTYPHYPLTPAKGFGDRIKKFRKDFVAALPKDNEDALDYWPANGMRHSAASYTLGAKIGDFGYLEQNFGNSRQMLMKHYLSWPSREQSEQFWRITPPKP